MLFNNTIKHISIVFLPAILITLIDPVVYADHSYDFIEAFFVNIGGLFLVVLFPIYFVVVILFPSDGDFYFFISFLLLRLILSLILYLSLLHKKDKLIKAELILTVLSLIAGRFILIFLIVG